MAVYEKAAGTGNLAAQDLGSLSSNSIGKQSFSQKNSDEIPFTDPQPNHLAFWAKKGSAAADEFQVESTRKKLKAIGVRWMGGKWNAITKQRHVRLLVALYKTFKLERFMSQV